MVSFKNSLFTQFYLIVFGFANLFETFVASNILAEINAINYEQLTHRINSDNSEIRFENDSSAGLVDGYNDSKCMQQFFELRKSFNRSELWALKG